MEWFVLLMNSVTGVSQKAEVLLFSIREGRKNASKGERMYESAFDDMERRCEELLFMIQGTASQVAEESAGCRSGPRTETNAILK